MNLRNISSSVISLLMLSSPCLTNIVSADSTAQNRNNISVEKSIDSGQLIYEKSNIELNKNGYDLTQQLQNRLNKLSSFTVLIAFNQKDNSGVQSLFGISNSKPGNSNSYLDIFLRDNGELGMEARDTSKKVNNLVSRPASLWGKYNKKSVENIIALSVNAKTKTYSLYANGTKVAEEYMTNFLEIKDIQGVDSYLLGGVNRSGKLDFGFDGKINQFKVFDNALSQTQLEGLTSNSISHHLIYKANDETGSNYFRIPVLYTFSNGRVFSSIDARYGGTHDFLNKINIATSYSDDAGITWRKPRLTLAFDDFANVPLDWPRSPQMRDLQISGGATYIDSVIVEKDKKAFLFADVMPAGVSFRDATRSDSGYKDINGHTYLKLKKQGESGYNYTVREGGLIYDDRTNSPTDFRVNSDFSLSKNGSALKTEQYSVSFENNKKTEYKNGKMVNMNIFYKDSLFKVVPTNYIAYITSSNFGDSWTTPKLLPPLMGLNRNAPYLGPGRGIVDSKTGRILISSYTGKESVFIYSDDNGLTWNQKTIPLPSSWSAEGQIVELSPGVLQTYMRTNNGKIAYITSYDSGNTWSKPQYLSFIHNPSYGTELSIINYSQKIDGKNAVILSTPNSPSGRRHGQIWIGLINSDNTIDWKYHHDIDNSQYGYSYSTLTELPNHKIGVMFEKFDSWSRNELHMKNVVPYISFDIKDLMS